MNREMKQQRYLQAFSQEELSAGMELLLSGECTTASRLATEDREFHLREYFLRNQYLQLELEYSEYQGRKKTARTAWVWVDPESQRVLKTECPCEEHRADRYGCAHTAAAFTSWFVEQEGWSFFEGTPPEQELKRRTMVEDPFAPGVMKPTDSRLRPFLRGGQTENALPVWESGKTTVKNRIRVEYDIMEVQGSWWLSLRAGAERRYVVKELPDFLEAYRRGAVYTFGKNDRELSADNCDDFANGLLQLMLEALDKEERNRSTRKYFRAEDGSRNRRYFAMDARYMGRFLHLLDGAQLELGMERGIPVELARKGLEATLRRKTHGASLQVKTMRVLADDGTALYLRDEKGVFSVPMVKEENTAILKELLTLGESLYVRESDIPGLQQNVLPLFEKYGRVIVKGLDLKRYQREVPRLELYLDVAHKTEITCEPFSCYQDPEARYRLFDNTQGIARRNGAAESGFARYLMDLFGDYQPAAGILTAEKGEEELYEFLADTLPDMQEKATVYITDRLKKLEVRRLPRPQMKLGVKSSGLLVDLRGTDLSPGELREVLAAYSVKKKYFRLKSGAFVRTDTEDEKVWETLADLFRHSGGKDAALMKLPLYRALYLREMMQNREDVVKATDSYYDRLVKTMESEAAGEVPASLAGVLRPYQAEGLNWIRRLKSFGFGGILADDMGLGKTLQVLAFLLGEKQAGKSGRDLRTIIICPASLVYNWQREVGKFTPELSCVVIAGTQAARQQLIADSGETDIWITSYDLMKRDVGLYEGLEFANEIIDEAQFIKNQHTQAAQSVRIVKADFRMALTGTPIENHLGELWSILDYLMPGFLYSYPEFQREYQLPITAGQDEEALGRLRRMVHPFILRRLKQDVLKELPDKLEEAVVVKLEGEQRQLYDAYASRVRQSLARKDEEEFRTGKLEVLAELTRLRQLCCDPALLVENYAGGSAKLEACLELVDRAVAGGHKVLLFSQFTSMLDILCERIARAGHAYYRIDGSVSKEKRMDMVESFAYDEVPIFCISLKAGGTGLNLTAADIVIHYDPWWNQAAQNQATDRAHRIGQEHMVTVYELIAEGTIEEQIQNIKLDKARLMEDVLSGESVAATRLEKEELLELLAGV